MMRSCLSIITPLILAAAVVPALAQSPAEVANQLSMHGNPKLPALIRAYGLRDAVSNASCGDFDRPSVKELWRYQAEHIAAIEISSRSCLRKFLIVFRESQSAWTYSGTISLDQRYGKPDYEVSLLLPHDEPSLVVHGNVVDAGSGTLQKNLQIFALFDRRVRIVFNEAESIRLAVPFKPDCCPVQYTETQSSSFQIVPSTGPGTESRIDETRHVEVNDTSLVQYRSFHWDSALQTFVSVAFAPKP